MLLCEVKLGRLRNMRRDDRQGWLHAEQRVAGYQVLGRWLTADARIRVFCVADRH